MKRTLVLLVASVAFGVFAVAGSAAPKNATLLIRHQVHGCHTWSVNGGAFKAVQTIHVARGGSIVVTNNDAMYHQIVKTAGPTILFKLLKVGTPMKGTVKLPFARGMMGRPGATLRMTFPKAGVYRLTTKFGEDYMEMGPTVGEDNVLRAIVTVS